MLAVIPAELPADVVKELELMRAYAGLTDGWAGENSKGPTEDDLALIERIFLAQQDKGWRPMLGEDGKVGLYYHDVVDGENLYRDIEVENGEHLSLFIRHGKKETWHERLTFNEYMLINLNPGQE